MFNIGAETPYTVSQLAKAVASALGKPQHPIIHLAPRNEVKIAYSSHDAVKSVFGHLQDTPLEEGLRKMAKWVAEVGARSTPKFKNIELPVNMPSSWV